VHPSSKLIQPCTEPIARSVQVHQTGPSPVNEKAPRVTIATLTNAEKHGFASCRVLLGHETQPSGQVSSFPELPRVASGCQQRSCDERSNARNRHQPTRSLIIRRQVLDFRRNLLDALLKASEIVEEVHQQSAYRGRQIICLIDHDTGKVELEPLEQTRRDRSFSGRSSGVTLFLRSSRGPRRRLAGIQATGI